MVLGGIWCPTSSAYKYSYTLRQIKEDHGVPRHAEMKWTKVSPSRLACYLAWVNYFFDSVDLNLRALVIPDKNLLDHKSYGHSHEDWYWKMYFEMLKTILKNDNQYRIFLDYKDTQGRYRASKLHEVLSNNMNDFDHTIIRKIQLARSHELELLQVADILIGAIGYSARGLKTSKAKLELIAQIKNRSGLDLRQTTQLGKSKWVFGIYCWISNPIPSHK